MKTRWKELGLFLVFIYASSKSYALNGGQILILVSVESHIEFFVVRDRRKVFIKALVQHLEITLKHCLVVSLVSQSNLKSNSWT